MDNQWLSFMRDVGSPATGKADLYINPALIEKLIRKAEKNKNGRAQSGPFQIRIRP